MRVMLVAAAVALAFASVVSCRTPPLAHPFTDDFGTAMEPVDLAAPPPGRHDLATPSMGCASLASCINQCGDANCQTTCFTQASPDAQNAYQSALSCIYDYCLTATGTRPPRCVEDKMMNFVDPPDAGVGVCDQCIANAYAALGMYACMPQNDPDCNPSQCATAVKTCLAQ